MSDSPLWTDGGARNWFVAVGSTNPSKVVAAQAVFGRVDSSCSVMPYAVDSGVSKQPWGKQETLVGAFNRARRALAAGGAQMAVGMEGGLQERADGLYVISLCAVVDRYGNENWAGGASLRLPSALAEAIGQAGPAAELGPIIDRLAGRPGAGRVAGAIGLLTKGLVDRRQNWETALAYALIPWLQPHLFNTSNGGGYMATEEHRRWAQGQVARCYVITTSDTRTPETDGGGDLIRQMLSASGNEIVGSEIVPDDTDRIRSAVAEALNNPAVNTVLVTGGTGIAPRDQTPEAVKPLLERELPGFGELFRVMSFEEVGAAALLSRAFAGTVQGKLVFCLPGSPNAVRLAMDRLIVPEIRHLLSELGRRAKK